MRFYRVGWQVACLVVCLVGTGAALLLSAHAVVALFLSFTLLGAVGSLAWRAQTRLLGSAGDARFAIRAGVLGGAVACAFFGWVAIVGAAAMLLGLGLLVASPWVVGTYLRWLGTPTGDDGTTGFDRLARAMAHSAPAYLPLPLPPDPPSPEPRSDGATDEELCRRWQASFVGVRHHDSPPLIHTLVADRQRCLDELQRRDPGAFAAWLASAPGPADSPLPYLRGRRSTEHDIDWDALIREQDR